MPVHNAYERAACCTNISLPSMALNPLPRAAFTKGVGSVP